MDLDDWGGAGAGAPSQAPPRRAKFAPKSSKFKPKTEQQQPEPAPKPSEPENLSASIPEEDEPMEDVKPTINVEEEEVKPTINVIPKAEPSVSNGAVENEHENIPHDAMEVDKEVEEDMVVREIDVFFTPSIDANTKLYVMQYPLRPCWRPYELEEKCQEVRVKAGSAEVEMDMSVDVSTNWDAKIADRLEMTKQTLLSSSTSPHVYGHSVGVLMGNKLHLNPIHAVVQLQPSMDYLSLTGARRTNEATIVADQTVKLEDSNEGKPVGASRKQNKRMGSGNEQKLEGQESWIPLKYHDSKSEFSSGYRQKMVAQEDSSTNEFKMSPYDYMSTLCPATTNNSVKPKGPSKKVLLSLPLEERMKKLLLEGPPVQRFSVLKHFAPDDSVKDVLKVLRNHGLLVQGLWGPKSELLFPNEGPKQAARDYVLLLFSKSVVASVSEINALPKLKEDVKIFLNTYAIERPNGWKFKEQADASFVKLVKLYPKIFEDLEEYWEKLNKRFNEHLNKKDKPGMKRATKKPDVVGNPVNSVKNTTKAGSGVLSKTTMTNETREALRKVLPKVFQNRKVCSFELICQGLRDLAVSQSSLPKADPRVVVAAASGAEAPPEELQEVIVEVATRIHGLYVLKSSPDHPELDPLRRAVISLLQVRGPNAKLRKGEVIEAAKPGLKRTATPNEFQKVISDICESRGSHWVLKSGDGKPS